MPAKKFEGRFINHRQLFQVVTVALVFGSCSATASADSAERYAEMLADAESMAAHNEFVQRQIASQATQTGDLEAELATLEGTATALAELLIRMHSHLKEFVGSDLPFADTVASREERLERLDQLMADTTVPATERYRRLLEAYQIEMEYGRTLETYKGRLDDGQEVDFIRVGRIALLYLTVDGSQAAYWNQAEKRWVVDNNYRADIGKALRVANKSLAPDLIIVPVPAPQEVRS